MHGKPLFVFLLISNMVLGLVYFINALVTFVLRHTLTPIMHAITMTSSSSFNNFVGGNLVTLQSHK